MAGDIRTLGRLENRQEAQKIGSIKKYRRFNHSGNRVLLQHPVNMQVEPAGWGA